ncbi:MAG: ribonuclease P protein component [Actinobacteria bacterium]|nr:ribonuclease P protein component [Actinomycetota bacterium]
MGELRVAYVPPGSSKGARVAYAVTRQTGGAVTRNRIRRRLRAAITQMGVALPPGDYLIGAGAGITQLPFEELKAQLWKAIEATTTAAERP